jgi:hypothetical protein
LAGLRGKIFTKLPTCLNQGFIAFGRESTRNVTFLPSNCHTELVKFGRSLNRPSANRCAEIVALRVKSTVRGRSNRNTKDTQGET